MNKSLNNSQDYRNRKGGPNEGNDVAQETKFVFPFPRPLCLSKNFQKTIRIFVIKNGTGGRDRRKPQLLR